MVNWTVQHDGPDHLELRSLYAGLHDANLERDLGVGSELHRRCLTAAIPMRNPYCSRATAYSCNPCGEPLLQPSRGLQLQSLWRVPTAAEPRPPAAIPMESPYCSCELTRPALAARRLLTEIAGLRPPGSAPSTRRGERGGHADGGGAGGNGRPRECPRECANVSLDVWSCPSGDCSLVMPLF